MYLKRIEIAGFKSFAKKTSLDFRTPITAIVGPNGSGKSNVAEAFSFVLGEQSMKSLRGKRGDDLIFNGSKNTPRSNRASVKVVFDNRKQFLNIDFDEVVVERVVHSDGANDYLINSSKVRLKDIVELLSGANIGPSGHHIISQGEADRVLNVSPKERRVLIEDASGLKIYQIKKKDSERRLDKTEENLKQVESLRREIKPHLNFLGKQVSKIEKTLEMKKELKDLYTKYLTIESKYLEKQKDFLQKELKDPKEKRERLQEEYRKAKKRFEQSLGEEDKKKIALEKSKLEKTLEELEVKKEEALRLEGRLEGELSSLERLLQRKEEEESEVVPLQTVRVFLEDVLKEISSFVSLEDISSLKIKAEELKSKIKVFSSEVVGKRNGSLDEMKGRMDKIKQEISETKAGKEALFNKEKIIKKELEELEKSIFESKGEGLEAEKEIYRIDSLINKLSINIERLEEQEDKLLLEKEDFKRELEEAKAILGIIPEESEGIIISESRLNDRQAQKERLKEVQKIKIRIEESGGASGEEIIKEFDEVKERDEFLEKEIEDLKKTRKSLLDLIADLEGQLENDFKQGLTKINSQFKEFFSLMFGGGNASLRLVRERVSTEEEEFVSQDEKEDEKVEEGVEIDVNLPAKKIKGLMMLSGGERALTSIALIFAMSQVNPPPFIVLDETDAALDEANSRRYGDMIENLAKHSELILITHNRETMSRAGVLYGVTMSGNGVSEVLSVDLERAVEVAK